MLHNAFLPVGALDTRRVCGLGCGAYLIWLTFRPTG
jgi:hypothetical protein